MDTVSPFSLYCRWVFPQGTGGSITARTDLKSIQIFLAGVGHFMNPACFVELCMNDMCASFSARSTASTLATYHLSSYTAATQSPTTRTTSASSGHSLRRCCFHKHGDSGLNLPLVKHCWQWHDVSLAMTFPGACDGVNRHCAWYRFQLSKFLNF